MKKAHATTHPAAPLWVRVLEWAALVPRLLFGFMFTMTGVGWFRRQDAAAYLADAIGRSPGVAAPEGPYDVFLAQVVLEHPGLFAFLVGAGELLSGLALLLGYPRRAGALGGAFLTINYGLAAHASLFPPSGNVLLASLLLLVATRWPYARLAWRGPFGAKADELSAADEGSP